MGSYGGPPFLTLREPLGGWESVADRDRRVRWAREDDTLRACVACDEVYRGPVSCPACGEPGEPLRPLPG